MQPSGLLVSLCHIPCWHNGQVTQQGYLVLVCCAAVGFAYIPVSQLGDNDGLVISAVLVGF